MHSPRFGFISPLPPRFATSPFGNTNRNHRQGHRQPSRTRHHRAVRAMAVLPGAELVRPPQSSVSSTGPLSASQIETFFEQGYVVVPQLVPPNLLAAMVDAIPAVENAKPMTMAMYKSLAFRVWDCHPIFKQVATSSPVAAAAAQLTPVDTSPTSQRSLVVLKDAYFRMQGSNTGCGFHVDDPFFWPCQVDAPGPGVNAWIALNDVTENGGGLTVAPASHGQSFLDCREAIEGTLFKTCMLAQLAPEKNSRLERIAVSPVMQAGDVLLHTRWLFHRGNSFKSGSKEESGEGIARYSVRYMPGNAIVNNVRTEDGDFVIHPGVMLKDADADEYPEVKFED